MTADCGYLNGLRWNDFDDGVGATDYDLYVYNGNGTVLQDTSEDDQQSGALPIERTADCTTTRIQIKVKLADLDDPSASGDVLELLMNGVEFERWTNAGSASGPAADTANPGALTVGAIDPSGGTTVGYYSSRGPTNDGRIKPDITAASCLTSVVTTPYCFSGTSASAPVVTGAAVLYGETQPTATAEDVANWLRTTAVVDRGPVGLDNTYGAGEMILPSMGPRPRYRPDARISATRTGVRIGNNRYNNNGANQSITQRVRGREVVPFFVRLENDGTGPENLAVSGSRSAFGFTIQYFPGIAPNYNAGQSVTGQVTRGTYRTPELDPGEHFDMTIHVLIPRVPRAGGIRAVLRVVSYANFTTADTVGFTAQLP